MLREPKVACVELRCIMRDWPKGNDWCKICKPRREFLAAIEEGCEIVGGACEEVCHNPFKEVRV